MSRGVTFPGDRHHPTGHRHPRGLPEAEWTIARAFEQLNGPLYYEYDFGDSWVHPIELIEAEAADVAGPRAHLRRGEQRGPFEDAGGVGGYEQKLEALADPEHPDHDDIRHWVSLVIGPWFGSDPDTLDVDHVNRELVLLFDQTPDAARPPRAIDTLLDRLPLPLRRELRGYAHRIGALDTPAITAEEAARMVEPYVWLIRRVGTDGLALTAAGWLPPAVVSDAMSELGWQDRWFGKMNREDQTMPIARLRASAQRFGLLRKLKGRLVQGSPAKRTLDDPLALWRYIAGAVALRHRDQVEQDMALLLALEVASGRHAGMHDYREPIAFGLGVLGWVGPDNRPLTPDDVGWDLADTYQLLASLGVFEQDSRKTGGVTPGGRAFARAVLQA